MHKFNNDWLFLREKIDKVSRNKKIIEKINKYFQDYEILSIADLGCGTGSNYRYMYPKLKKRQSWDMIDISFESCLLYTSPSPRDDCPSRMPSSA